MESNRVSLGFGLTLPKERYKPKPALPGENHHCASLTNEQVKEIYGFRFTGRISQVELAKRYNTQQSTISRIWNRKMWSTVTDGVVI